jgi:hypothetical protein
MPPQYYWYRTTRSNNNYIPTLNHDRTPTCVLEFRCRLLTSRNRPRTRTRGASDAVQLRNQLILEELEQIKVFLRRIIGPFLRGVYVMRARNVPNIDPSDCENTTSI